MELQAPAVLCIVEFSAKRFGKLGYINIKLK